jgi:hypothetical protein
VRDAQGGRARLRPNRGIMAARGKRVNQPQMNAANPLILALKQRSESEKSIDADAPEENLSTTKISQLVDKASHDWLEAAMAGDFAAAWVASDEIHRAQIDHSGTERWQRPLWDGSPIDDRHVLIRCWRGLGDAIHFIRYAPLVRAKARSLTVEAPRSLVSLFEGVSGIDRLFGLDEVDLRNEGYVEVESTELPYLFRTTLASIPSEIPYIRTKRSWPMEQTAKLRIGLCWCGGSYDPRRSIHLSDLESHGRLPEALFFQLQRGPALDEAIGSPVQFQNLADRSMDISMTASLIDTLDIVISVDTMVGHLAGALGRKVYLLLHSEADWRWLRDREDSPWYPTMTLLRQPRPGDWRPVVSRLADLLWKVSRD